MLFAERNAEINRRSTFEIDECDRYTVCCNWGKNRQNCVLRYTGCFVQGANTGCKTQGAQTQGGLCKTQGSKRKPSLPHATLARARALFSILKPYESMNAMSGATLYAVVPVVDKKTSIYPSCNTDCLDITFLYRYLFTFNLT